MSKTHTNAGKRLSAMTHARYGYDCEFCGRRVFGNGGRVAHARSHVRSGEAVELMKWFATLSNPSRLFLRVDQSERIAGMLERGYELVAAGGQGS